MARWLNTGWQIVSSVRVTVPTEFARYPAGSDASCPPPGPCTLMLQPGEYIFTAQKTRTPSVTQQIATNGLPGEGETVRVVALPSSTGGNGLAQPFFEVAHLFVADVRRADVPVPGPVPVPVVAKRRWPWVVAALGLLWLAASARD